MVVYLDPVLADGLRERPAYPLPPPPQPSQNWPISILSCLLFTRSRGAVLPYGR
jgi:hypothetical protein